MSIEDYKKFLKDEFKKDMIWGIERDSDQPEKIIYINDALKKLDLPEDFSMVDIACGHATVMNGIKHLYPKMKAIIVDIRRYDEWKNIAKKIIKIELPLTKFIEKSGNKVYDVVMMLNSYRNWSRVKRQKIIFDEWLVKHAKYFITSNGNLDYEKGEISGTDYKDYPLELYKLPLSKKNGKN